MNHELPQVRAARERDRRARAALALGETLERPQGIYIFLAELSIRLPRIEVNRDSMTWFDKVSGAKGQGFDSLQFYIRREKLLR